VRAALGAVVACSAVWVCADVATHGWRDLAVNRPAGSNHLLDDRTGVGWLVSRTRPGDAVLTTALALPALWWYSGTSIAPPASGRFLPDGSRILQVSYAPARASCGDHTLARALAGHNRVLVYFGFRFDDVPKGFDDLLLQELRAVGRVRELQEFTGVTRAAIVELGRAPQAIAPLEGSPVGAEGLPGCVSVRPAMRW
jgi:hypothetical protein